jgi:hypothetical protein
MSRLKKAFLVAVGAIALLFVGSTAQAVVTSHTGTFSDQQQFVHETDAWTTGSTAWVNVPTAVTSITIPAGTTRMLDVRYSAESQCAGSSGWCSVRVVVYTPSGGVIELSPVVGTDFAFDSASADNWESHAIERTSAQMGAGTYRVQVQATVVAGATQLRLDDWTLAVEAVRP